MTKPQSRKIVVAIGGATGAIYAKRLLDTLHQMQVDGTPLEVGVCMSRAGEKVWRHELGEPADLPFRRYALDDFSAPFASGSAGWHAMVVLPCSGGGLARIAHGISDDLIGRAADVMLKERRRLVLVMRETPLSTIHLENMLHVSRAGAVVLPASPSFYSHPRDLNELVDTVLGRVLDHLDLHNAITPRWGENGSENLE